MIIYPSYWPEIGCAISIEQIEDSILAVLYRLKCRNLALSGGVDSTTMLALMLKVFRKEDIHCFNIALNASHPDYIYSQMAADHFKVDLLHWVPNRPLKKEECDFEGDENVREFFRCLSRKGIDRIICCDGVDEFMGGYYDHMKNPTEEVYYDYMRRLQKEQLEPLHKNSGNVKVLLPYIDRDVILLFSQIPYSEKFDNFERKKIMNCLARNNGVPEEIITRHKYGFIDAMKIKESKR